MRHKIALLGIFFIFFTLSVTAHASDIVSLVTVRRTAQEEHLQYDYAYPYLEAADHLEQLQDINAKLKETAERELLRAKRAAHRSDTLISGSTEFSVPRNSLHIVSVVFQCKLSAGEQEVDNHQKALCFNSETGAVYRLFDLFCEGQDYTAALSAAAKQAVNDQGLTDMLQDEELLVRHNTQFYLTENNLVLLYHPDTCFSKQAGCVQLLIPFERLSTYLKEGFFR